MELAHLSDVKRAECVRTSPQLQEVELKRRSELPSPVDTGTIKVIDGVETLRAASR
jgi:hypothetical protein